ncbi:unnamed protein product [Arabidopsis arenosa]|uniref:Uncharacterized protein n=1 Tax=Arabidopsis arenosa TaxID=38785 RepID=A0A8S2A1L1_ARAAE|nr:unnamed protein product [Arabidopsis arenosa]CAE6012777.1 unnamed protein product [Arabidopsis arenosa]
MSSLENHKRESVKGNQGVSYLQLKTQAASFLPVLQGTRDATLFTINKSSQGGVELIQAISFF